MKWLCLSAFALGLLSAQDPFQTEREIMVRDQVERRGVKNGDVLKAMRRVQRHLFVPEGARSLAYKDHPLPIGSGQTISQPYIVALMTELLELNPSLRVLEIGTGSGYQAAVLSRLFKEVYSIEIVPELAEYATDRLADLDYDNVTVRHGDGYLGWPEQAPFDRIILTAAPPELPPALLDQLKPGGRLVAPVGGRLLSQQLVVVDKDSEGNLQEHSIIPVRFVPMVRKD